jgi:2,4-dienoyl-CoA reductase-like NADH-dependent reductase (Old Yellow Enzyme family)
MSLLFEPISLRNVVFRNRLWVSPMCQYSSEEGMPTDWHLVHLGSRAVGGAGLVIVEATAVSPDGRISPQDSGIWSDAHADAFRRITAFITEQGSVPGIQLAHAGRKASTAAPWNGGLEVPPAEGGWQTIAPSAVPFSKGYPMPREMAKGDIARVTADFVAAAKRSVEAGFQVVEIHAAHGYLFHEFLSPLSNHRTDEYGGSLHDRMRFLLNATREVRAAVPEDLPLFVRISATDWTEGGWDLDQSVELSRELKALGVDLMDVSTGGNVPDAPIPVGPNYQVPFSAAIRERAGMPTAAVGLITEPKQAEEILEQGEADAIVMAREFLRDPYFVFRAAEELGGETDVPRQYGRAIRVRPPAST